MALATLLCFPLLLQSMSKAPMQLSVTAPDTSEGPHFLLTGKDLPPYQMDGSLSTEEQPVVSPGLHYAKWQHQYRGDHKRSIGHAQLVGPFQSAKTPPCSTTLYVNQSILDASEEPLGTSRVTIATVARNVIVSQLQGMRIWPLGDFLKLQDLHLRWVKWDKDRSNAPWKESLLPALGNQRYHGHLEISLDVHFEKGKVPLRLFMTPKIEEGAMTFGVDVKATLDLNNRFYQWVANVFDGNDRASTLIAGQIRSGLRYVLDKPPPIPLGNGSYLQTEFCKDKQVLFSDLGYVAVPLAIVLENQQPFPPLSPQAPPNINTPMRSDLAIDIDTNGLNAILHTLWASKLLDTHLATTLVSSFNQQETVRNFLSLRLASARFHLPPTITLDPSFQLRAAAAIVIHDKNLATDARLFTQIGFGLELLQPDSNSSQSLSLRTMELTCLPSPGVLKNCYSGLMEQVRANQEPLQNLLTSSFTNLVSALLTRREFSDSNTPARYLLEKVHFTLVKGRLRASLHGTLEEK